MNRFAETRQEFRTTPEQIQKERVALITQQLEELGRQYGRDALASFIEGLHNQVSAGDRVRPDVLVQQLESEPVLEDFQVKALEWFQKDGVVEFAPDGTMVIDQEKLAGANIKKMAGRSIPGKEKFGSTKIDFIAHAFKGKQAVSKEAWDQGERTASDVLYLPENKDDAFDQDKIRSANFHFGLWELAQPMGEKDMKAKRQPGALDNLGYFESSLAAVIYHPKFGDGRRDSSGRLSVRHKDGTLKPITGAWLHEMLPDPRTEKGSNLLRDNTLSTMTVVGENLFTRGLVKKDDFRQRSTGALREQTPVAQAGLARFENVRYSIGREYANHPVRLEKVNDEIGAIVALDENGIGRIESTFSLFKAGDARLTERETTSGKYWDAPKSLVAPRAFQQQDFIERREGETDEVYLKRLQDMEDFDVYLSLDNDLKKKTDTHLRELEPSLSQSMRQHPEFIRKNLRALVEAADLAGKDGLAAIALLLDVEGASLELMKVLPKIPESQRGHFLGSLKTAIDARDQALVLLEEGRASGELPDAQLRQVRYELNRRVTSLIVAVEDATRSNELIAQGSLDKVMKSMAHRSADTILFAKIFKDAFKGGKEAVDWSQIKGMEFESRLPEEISDQDRTQMLTIFDENWKDQDQIAAKAFRKMLETKSAPENKESLFYVLKKDQNISAFLRLDQRDDIESGAYYFGSMNVASEYRGSAIGDAFMHQTLDKEAVEHTLFAHVVPDAIVGARYVEDGFVITGVDTVMVDGQEAIELAIRRDDRRSRKFHGSAEQVSTEQLLNGVASVDVEKFHYPQEKEAFLQAIRNAVKQGKVATRYFVDPVNRSIRYLAFEPDAAPDFSSRSGR